MSNSYWDITYAQWLYQYLLSDIGNDFGVSGLMGNLYAESYICPFICEGDTSTNFATSDYYTNYDLRSNTRSYFISFHLPGTASSKTGYSLAQWTTSGRKGNYFDYVGQSNLGDSILSAHFLLDELKTGYSSTYNVLVNASSIAQASDYVLEHYEAPLNWQQYINIRRQYSQQVYDDFSGLPPVPVNPIPIWLLKKSINNRRRK